MLQGTGDDSSSQSSLIQLLCLLFVVIQYPSYSTFEPERKFHENRGFYGPTTSNHFDMIRYSCITSYYSSLSDCFRTATRTYDSMGSRHVLSPAVIWLGRTFSIDKQWLISCLRRMLFNVASAVADALCSRDGVSGNHLRDILFFECKEGGCTS